jgi:hypothetical protein
VENPPPHACSQTNCSRPGNKDAGESTQQHQAFVTSKSVFEKFLFYRISPVTVADDALSNFLHDQEKGFDCFCIRTLPRPYRAA